MRDLHPVQHKKHLRQHLSGQRHRREAAFKKKNNRGGATSAARFLSLSERAAHIYHEIDKIPLTKRRRARFQEVKPVWLAGTLRAAARASADASSWRCWPSADTWRSSRRGRGWSPFVRSRNYLSSREPCAALSVFPPQGSVIDVPTWTGIGAPESSPSRRV